jgi:hypothetical protein
MVTPHEARARARAILESQKHSQVIELNSDGTLAKKGDPPQFGGKRTVLHDPKGEYVR